MRGLLFALPIAALAGFLAFKRKRETSELPPPSTEGGIETSGEFRIVPIAKRRE